MLSLKFRYTKSKKIPKGFTVKDGEVPKLDLWKWQNQAYAGFWNSNGYYIINALMASGKGTAIKGIAVGALENEYKVLIITPNGFIGDNFSSEERLRIQKKKWYTWEVLEENNFCGYTKNKCMELGRWCKRSPLKDTAYNIALCNFPTFVKNFKHIQKNTLVIVDEMHHICMEPESQNNLGKAMKHFFKNDIKVLGCTATPFRGDGCEIIASEYLDNFEVYRLDAIKYFEEVTRWINGFNYNIYFTEDSYLATIKDLCKDHIGKLIISLPSGNHRHSYRFTKKRSKKEEVEDIVKSIFDEFTYTDDRVLIKAKRNSKVYDVLDIVDDTKNIRQKRREYLKENKDTIDVIINIDVFSEGADWPQANRLIVCGDRGSITKKFQNEGRILRDHPSKKNNPPVIEHVIPYLNLKNENEENVREVANSLLVVTYQSMIMEYLYSPCKKKIKIKDRLISAKEYLFGELTEKGFLELLSNITNEWLDSILNGVEIQIDDIIKQKLEEEGLEINKGIINFLKMEWKKKIDIDEERERKNQKVKKSVKVNKIPIDIDIVNGMRFIEGIYKVADYCKIHNLKDFATLIRGHQHRRLLRIKNELIPWIEKNNRLPAYTRTNLGLWKK